VRSPILRLVDLRGCVGDSPGARLVSQVRSVSGHRTVTSGGGSLGSGCNDRASSASSSME
jgi:hypothetical protein